MEWSAGIAAHAIRKHPPARDTRRSYRIEWWPAAPDEPPLPPPPVSSQVLAEHEQARDPGAEQPERCRLGRKAILGVRQDIGVRTLHKRRSGHQVVAVIEMVQIPRTVDQVQQPVRPKRERPGKRG